MTTDDTSCHDLQVERARLTRDQVEAQSRLMATQLHLHQALRSRSREDRRALKLDADSVEALNAADAAYEELVRVAAALGMVNDAIRRHLADLDDARRERLRVVPPAGLGPVGGQHDGGVGGHH